MFYKKPDLKPTFIEIGHHIDPENDGGLTWEVEAQRFTNLLTDLIGNLNNLDRFEELSFDWGRNCVQWREFGFKPEFWLHFSEAMTTECLYMDQAVHSVGEVIEAW